MYMSKLSKLIISTIILVVTGCDNSQSDNDAAPKGSQVKIISISPSNTSPLQVGTTVNLSVEVEHTLTVTNGTLGLVVQAADNTLLAQDMDVVLKGKNKTVFDTKFIVPNTKVVAVFTPLSAEGQMQTTTVDMKAYKVVNHE
jgi:outer membrane lipoprotein SlyB